jgi:EAL domain-containing protein (putative c-di-GMP-specific phosphodiesterase class I)
VCAEGVETEQQRSALLRLGVHTAQGYLFGAPAAPAPLVATMS